MGGFNFRRALLVFFLTGGFIALAPRAALADCTNPVGVTGETIFNSTVGLLQFCNGTVWINAGAMGGGGAETDPEVGTLTPTKWCQANAGGTEIVCTARPASRLRQPWQSHGDAGR